MKKTIVGISMALGLLAGCSYRQVPPGDTLTSIQIIDRNGFQETISSNDRLSLYEKADFFSPQPYEKVVRMFGRTENGKTPSKVTTYHDNGQIFQYLEVVNGRACGVYREWHDNGKLRLDIRVIEGIGDLNENAQRDWVFDGISRAWDGEGRLEAEINYEKGKLQGTSIYYYPNSALKRMIPYESGMIDGDILYYNPQGKVIGKTPYIKGKREGIAMYQGDPSHPPYSEEYHDDLLMNATYHDFTGKIIAKIENGFGKQVIYVDGILDSIREYKNGLPEGEVQLFSSNGFLKTSFHIKEGVKHGPEWIYYPTSLDQEPRPKVYIEWANESIQGICRTWYPSGHLESEREIRDNKKHGICSAWYRDGSLMMIEEYEKDLLQRGKYLKKGESSPVSTVENGEGVATFYDSEGFILKRAVYQKGQPIDEL